MSQFGSWRMWLAALGLASALPVAAQAQAAGPAGLRLYALDCGRHETPNVGRLNDVFEHDGEPGERVSPCWLIRHPKGDLLWDLGWGDGYAARPEGTAMGTMLKIFVRTTLESQLATIGVPPASIRYVSVSHMHLDHTGNAPLFTGATWIVNRRELAWATGPQAFFVDAAQVKVVQDGQKVLIDGDHDVFGDGSVRILKAPGHTPGSQMLLVRLPKAGPVLLSGDLYHSAEAVEKSYVPGSNDSRADTLASMDRARRLVRNLKARLVVHHDPGHFAAMPRPPGYLE